MISFLITPITILSNIKNEEIWKGIDYYNALCPTDYDALPMSYWKPILGSRVWPMQSPCLFTIFIQLQANPVKFQLIKNDEQQTYPVNFGRKNVAVDIFPIKPQIVST